MRFCFITTDEITIKMFYRPIGEFLEKEGHEVFYIANFHSSIDIQSNYDSKHFVNVPMRRGLFVKDLIKMPSILKKSIVNISPDLVCYSTPNASYYVSKVLNKSSIKSIYFQFGLRFEGYKKGSIKRLISYILEKRTCRNSQRIESLTLLNSHKNLTFKLTKNPKKLGVVSSGGIPGVDNTVFHKISDKDNLRKKFNYKSDDFIIATMGRITSDKGYDTVIKSFLKLSIPSKKLIIIGDFDKTDPLSSEVESIIKTNPNIFVTGFIEQKEANEFLNMSNVFVHMSKREGFGQSVVEAMMCGLPTIVANVAGPCEVVDNEKTGFVVPVESVENLASKIEELYSNNQMLERFGQEGIKKAKEMYSREKVVLEISHNLLERAKN